MGVLKLKAGPSLKLKTGPSVFFTVFLPFLHCFLGILENTNSVTLCQNSVFARFWGCHKSGFRKENCIFLFLSFLCWRNRNRKNKNKQMEKAKKPNKNSFFKVVIQKCEKAKKWIFSNKNCLTLFVSGREKNAHFRAHYLFWPKISLDQNSVNQEKL